MTKQPVILSSSSIQPKNPSSSYPIVFLVDILEGFYAYSPLKNVVTMGVEDSSYR